MPFLRLAFFPGATPVHLAALERELADAPRPPERLVLASGVRDDGLQVVQVWTSRAALDDFNERWFRPAVARLADPFPAPPVVHDVEDADLHLGGPTTP